MRIKNLDTGEEFDLEEYDNREPSVSGHHNNYGEADHMGALDDDDVPGQLVRGIGAKKKAWLKSTKKLKTCGVRDVDRVQLCTQRSTCKLVESVTVGAGWCGCGVAASTCVLQGSALAGGLEGVVGDDDALYGGRRRSSDDGSVASTSASSPIHGVQKKRSPGEALDMSAPGSNGGGDGKVGPKVGGGGGAAATTTAFDTLSLPRDPSCSASSSRGDAASRPSSTTAVDANPAAAAAAAPLVTSVTALSTIALAEGGGQHQRSEDMRIPLLEEDQAGPSSRAVPTAKSWLNQPARVAGGRRSAGRQLQQVRMIQELLGHDGPVWAVKFSADARLLATAGRDGVLRVWSVYWYSPGSCCFHPSDPRCIVTGCADGKIRVWSVPDAAVVAYATVPQDLITRVVFSADGSRVVAGTLRGKARHYEFSSGGLDYLTQLDVKNPHGSGRKVTGLVQVPYTYGNDQLYVITSADSRIRLYVGYTQVKERKFKGHRHSNTQIAASLSPSCQHLICGSDDGWVYVWETGLPPPPPPLPGPTMVGALSGPTATATGGTATGATTSLGSAGLVAGRGRAGFGAGPGPGGKDVAAAVRGAGKVKEGVYEAFQTPEQTTTVALLAPNVCRLGRGLERLGRGPAAATGGGPASLLNSSVAQLPLLGALFVVVGFSGKIYVYENLPMQGMM
ncbi:hypothetical protein VOLCADRAFT_86245 [Volvox carteri f. nagariensis]|uniref:Uncharacterized protein n=1 Tax=Volvox carteri f. nagariensis TaxID=3068 RepID=D8TI98_VOLCA|nr:uncharacterized protein VOLCADRAFT_86245 [Volvox carteri f. nagariensis]EFJ53205.1 hypothetical protein VOLCADRAFT_86245 [Volvox carteri f. nagariensis]|eukprot:XP_002946210.1 hypothetical protein VOLCADRAFT_86245 [Volvox carteri f. nagariensis]